MRKIKALGSNLEDFELLEISNFLKKRFGFVETKSYCTILNYKCQNFNVDKKVKLIGSFGIQFFLQNFQETSLSVNAFCHLFLILTLPLIKKQAPTM